jgi:methionyl-tRNA formyltransferase
MTPPSPWRVVIATRILPVALGFYATLQEAGHEPVALLTIRDVDGRYGGFELGPMLNELPGELDVLMPARRAAIAPLLESCRPDLRLCMGFPWKVPADALSVPALGWLNGHPSLLPRHRGPVPVAWAIRAGEEEIGISFHRMDAELDTGPVLAQRTVSLGEYAEPEELYGRLGPTVVEVLRNALDRLAAGEEGTTQEGGDYQSFFTDDDAWLDLSRPAVELHRLVWAWRYTIPRGRLHGALAELDGTTVRVLASSLADVDGARRVECADGPLWLVRTEPVSEPEAATDTSAPDPATR